MKIIRLFAVLPKICVSTSTFPDFCSYFQLTVVIYKEMFEFLRTSVSLKTFQQERAANRFKVLRIFISLKVTAYIKDRRLWSEKALDAQDFKWESNCTEMAKYTCDFKYKIYKQQNLAKQFTSHSAEAYSEPFPTSKQGDYTIGGNYFHKNIHLRRLKRF